MAIGPGCSKTNLIITQGLASGQILPAGREREPGPAYRANLATTGGPVPGAYREINS